MEEAIELLPPDGSPNHCENARPNHGANAERGERNRPQCLL